jgi:hypothetical protein
LQANLFYNGCVIVEVRDYRRTTNGSFDSKHVLLKPTPEVCEQDYDGQIFKGRDNGFSMRVAYFLCPLNTGAMHIHSHSVYASVEVHAFFL